MSRPRSEKWLPVIVTSEHRDGPITRVSACSDGDVAHFSVWTRSGVYGGSLVVRAEDVEEIARMLGFTDLRETTVARRRVEENGGRHPWES